MAKLEQKMIFRFGKSKKGFTLLEVLVSVIIFGIAFTAILKIQSKNISAIYESIQKLEALNYFKESFYGISQEKQKKFKITKERKETDFGLKETKYIIFDKNTEKKILIIKVYEE